MTETDNNLVVRDAHGDPLPLGTHMIEKESYERIIDGLKIAAEGAAHVSAHELRIKDTISCLKYAGIARRLDQVRLLAVELAGIDETAMTQKETVEVRGEPMRFLRAKHRLRDGLKQATGGFRQFATCHRGDLRWSKLAFSLEELQRKIDGKPSAIMRPPAGLLLPNMVN